MSFKINWDAIELDSLSTYSRDLLEEALNSGKRPSVLADDIKIKDLNFGTIPPSFQILEIGDLGVDKFRGIFNFKYYGNASITVTTKISASLLKNYNNNIDDDLSFIKPNFIVSDCDFDIPLNLTLSNFKMSSIIIVVFSKTKGLTLVFKNDPLENIDVNSTFDRIQPIANFLQKKIEIQISELFKEFLPSLLYKFSLKYTTQSFDQFHKDLLSEEQEGSDNRRKNKILLKDLDPENPFRISPGSLMRLTRLASSRQTLAIDNGNDKLSCDKLNKEVISKSFMNSILNSSNSYNANKLELSEVDFKFGNIHNKIDFIKNFQNRNFIKNNSLETKPKRRVVKMRSKRNLSKKSSEEIKDPVPSISIDELHPPVFSDDNDEDALTFTEDARSMTFKSESLSRISSRRTTLSPTSPQLSIDLPNVEIKPLQMRRLSSINNHGTSRRPSSISMTPSGSHRAHLFMSDSKNIKKANTESSGRTQSMEPELDHKETKVKVKIISPSAPRQLRLALEKGEERLIQERMDKLLANYPPPPYTL